MRLPRSLPLLSALLVILAMPLRLSAQDGWVVQGSLGAVASAQSRLTIHQSGYPDLKIDANYETRPFESPQYYMLRAGRWSGRTGWEVEIVHHKLYLRHPPPEIHDFSISHGYNLLTVDRAWEARWLILRAGAGLVVGHPENTVRNRTLEPGDTNLGGGYHLAGGVLQLAAEKRLTLGDHWFVGVEGKLTGARARVPVAGGSAEVPNVALHGLLGIGWRR